MLKAGPVPSEAHFSSMDLVTRTPSKSVKYSAAWRRNILPPAISPLVSVGRCWGGNRGERRRWIGDEKCRLVSKVFQWFSPADPDTALGPGRNHGQLGGRLLVPSSIGERVRGKPGPHQ